MPAADIDVDAALVRTLLSEQHPDLADLPLYEAVEGWDNKLFRLGNLLAVRVPRRVVSARLIEHEQRWLPQLTSTLPLPVPTPIRFGRPGRSFPWSWSVVPWLPGDTALGANIDGESVADNLGAFLQALHRPAPADAPVNTWRGVGLAARNELLQHDLDCLGTEVDRGAVLALWKRMLDVEPWCGPRFWIHGDLHPGNLLLESRRLAAVVDFGDLTSGDPATDLSVAWMLLPPECCARFRRAARTASNPIDDATWRRARGWALALGVSYLAHSGTAEPLALLGRATISAALADGP